MPKIIELRPAKELLNINFEKYQFSPQVVPISDEIQLSKDIVHREPSPGQDSLLEARLFAFHNHLFQNPYDDSCWFFDKVDDLFNFTEDGINKVHSPGDPNTKIYNSTIAFASPEICVVSYGGSTLHILLKNEETVTVFTENIEPGIVMDARYIEADNSIIVVMACIVEEGGKKKSKIYVLLYFFKSLSLGVVGKQELMVNGPVDYAFIESSGKFVDLLGGETAIFVHDSMKPIREVQGTLDIEKTRSYYWSQDAESLTILVTIPEEANAEIEVKVTNTGIKVTAVGKTTRVLLEGDYQFRIDADTAVWNREKDVLKLELMKYEERQMWSELIKGSTTGEYLPNSELAAEVHSQLSHLCSDKPETANTQPTIGFNADQLEDCDMEGDEHYLQRLDLTDHSTTHLAILGTSNRVLFTHNRKSRPCICIRQDHDGCVWTLIDDPNWDVMHTSTFPGFGYVEASKSNKKFCISPPGGRYIAIVEHTRHAFIYKKPEVEAKVAKQNIVDLGAESSAIMGAVATDGHLILLTMNKLYKLKVN